MSGQLAPFVPYEILIEVLDLLPSRSLLLLRGISYAKTLLHVEAGTDVLSRHDFLGAVDTLLRGRLLAIINSETHEIAVRFIPRPDDERRLMLDYAGSSKAARLPSTGRRTVSFSASLTFSIRQQSSPPTLPTSYFLPTHPSLNFYLWTTTRCLGATSFRECLRQRPSSALTSSLEPEFTFGASRSPTTLSPTPHRPHHLLNPRSASRRSLLLPAPPPAPPPSPRLPSVVAPVLLPLPQPRRPLSQPLPAPALSSPFPSPSPKASSDSSAPGSKTRPSSRPSPLRTLIRAARYPRSSSPLDPADSSRRRSSATRSLPRSRRRDRRGVSRTRSRGTGPLRTRRGSRGCLSSSTRS